jgi:hypothetical protein
VRRYGWVKRFDVLCFCPFLLLEHTCSGCNLFILILVSRVQVMEVVNGPEFGSPNSVVFPSVMSSSCLCTLKTTAMLERDESDVITPMTQSSLDPLMHTSVVTPCVVIAECCCNTNREDSHTCEYFVADCYD